MGAGQGQEVALDPAPPRPARDRAREGERAGLRGVMTDQININISIEETLTDADDCADALDRIADAMVKLHEAADAVMRASKNKSARNRARAYWHGHMETYLDSGAADGCDGIYGTVEDLRDAEGDENEDDE